MAWQDDVQEGAYTPLDGTRHVYQFEDLRQHVELRGSTYDFVDADGTFVQRTGNSGDSYPMRIYLTGPEYNLAADAFLEALRAPGVGVLAHPIHGTRDVVPLGRVVRRDDLKTAANQAIFEVTFWETIRTLFPSGQTDPASQVLQAVGDYNVAQAAEFEEVIVLGTAIETVALQSRVDALLSAAQAQLAPIAAATQEVADQFEDIFDSVNNSIQVLVGDPLTLAFQVNQLLQAPGRSIALWSDKLQGYRNLAQSIFGQEPRVSGNDSQENNAFHADDLSAAGALTGAIVGAVNNTFATRPQALEAAQDLLALSDDLNVWREANFDSLNETDTGDSYQQWQNATALAAGFLVQISFSLAQERVIILDRARTIVDLSAELYGTIDDRLDFLIDTNDLTGDEIRELPIGRAVKYYV
jgi:prophage DNA circulation protein